MAQLAIFMTVRTKPGKRDELYTLWESHLRPRARDNEQQSGYVLAFDAADENVIRITEVYESREAFEQNAQAEWFADYMKEAFPLLDGEPEFHLAHPRWVK